MKNTFLVLVILLSACSSSKQEDVSSSLDWLEGTWVRSNGQVGENTQETWTKTKSGFEGSAETRVNDSLVFSEKIHVKWLDGHWHYTVESANDTPVTFVSSAITDTSFVCENPENKFPKVITYIKENDCINASISNGPGTDEILFRYERKAE